MVSCCAECNWQKKDHAAAHFLREMYREGRLSREELSGRLAALRRARAGKLRPHVLGEKDAGIFSLLQKSVVRQFPASSLIRGWPRF